MTVFINSISTGKDKDNLKPSTSSGKETRFDSFRKDSTDINHAIFNHFLDSSIGLICIDEQGIINAVNPAAELAFGYFENDIVGKNISILMPEPFRSEHDAYLKRYCSGGAAHIVDSSRQVTGQRKDGTTFPMELAVTETIDNNKRIFLGSICDLSTEKHYESLEKKPVDIKELAYAVQQLVEPLAEEKGITFVNEVETNFCLFTDSTRCKQILINLISNAIKYNKADGYVTLKTRLSKNLNFLEIAIEDSGNGLTEQQFERLGAETTDIEGTGIGLTLTKELVELMGGEIGVTSKKGIGSCFWFTLPLLKKEAYSYSCELNRKQVKQEMEPNKKAIKHGKETVILYIEDDAANLKLVNKVVKKKLGYKFLGACDINTGIEIAKQHQPDMILMDIHLPGINGIEGKKIFSADPELKDIPIVAISASAMQNDIKQAIAAGFNKYLTKPINIKELQDTIKFYATRDISFK